MGNSEDNETAVSGLMITWQELREPIVFGIVGASLALVYFAIAYFGAAVIGAEAQVASAAAYLILIPVGYYAHRVVTFRSKSRHMVALPRFIASTCGGIALSWLVPYVAVRMFDAPQWMAFLAVCVVVPATSFAAAADVGVRFVTASVTFTSCARVVKPLRCSGARKLSRRRRTTRL